MGSINRVVLVGNLTRDPELRSTQGGTSVCQLGIAVNGREKVGSEWRDRADFFDITVWGNQADSCAQHLRKGSPVGIDGHLRLETWEKDGQKHSKVKVVANNVQFLGGRDQGGQQRTAPQGDGEFTVPQADFAAPAADFASAADDQDIPF